MNNLSHKTRYCCSGLLALTLAACGDGHSVATTPATPPPPTPVVTYQFEIEVTNLTQAQPISPVAAVLQTSGRLWTVGQPASVALERLAEAGDNSAILGDSQVTAKASLSGMLLPGTSAKMTIETTEMVNYLSVLGMPVNTNDAFSGLTGFDLRTLAVNSARIFDTPVYDAGTEGNSESAASVPGPAAGGEGFNSQRDDVNQVRMHSGVVSQQDGLSSSALLEAHRFDNPMLKIRIMRTK
ncbi:MAG: spondin domain-containing protein [Gammaproteobacteria bacterium]|jgi:hypothetical protein|nr:spondin domain-containing protein [Gammaproteobacteria bacterium]MBU2180368.1 spondin domain-containing protein [Gammaproteobacteria bacterium]MBU2222462.1 spondin domain-containing protein [Gammaproteobacteria bacterium]MBU2277297.1 spondin domain-containing protein [Gammaproteobacteria bacterium]MBU2428366.1 spondin domain-containing protein [Gammaproteobacteria bacterium]